MHVKNLIIISSLVLVGSISSAHSATKDPGILGKTHVDYIKVKSMGKVVKLKVSAKGKKYDTLNTNSFFSHYSASVKCKAPWDVHYFAAAINNAKSWSEVMTIKTANKPIGIYEDTLVKWGKDSGKKKINVANRVLKGPVSPELKKAALARCNQKAVKTAQTQNISVVKAMSTPQVVTLKQSDFGKYYRLSAFASCGKPKLWNTWLIVNDKLPTVQVECMAKPYRKPVNTVPLPLNTPMKISALKLSSNVTKHTGQCPKTIKLTAEITANKAGTVKYQWKTGNAKSIAQKLVFTKGQKRTVTKTVKMAKSKKLAYSIVTSSPHTKSSNLVSIDINCIYPQ